MATFQVLSSHAVLAIVSGSSAAVTVVERPVGCTAWEEAAWGVMALAEAQRRRRHLPRPADRPVWPAGGDSPWVGVSRAWSVPLWPPCRVWGREGHAPRGQAASWELNARRKRTLSLSLPLGFAALWRSKQTMSQPLVCLYLHFLSRCRVWERQHGKSPFAFLSLS